MFLARTNEQRRFEASLAELEAAAAKAGPSPVVILHGLGGMGKTELCKRFTAIAEGTLPEPTFKDGKFLAVTVDWQGERRNHGVDAAGFQPREALAAIYDRIANHPEVRNSWRWQRHVAKAFDPFLAVDRESADLERNLRPFSDGLTGDGDSDPGLAVTRAVQAIRESRSALESQQAGRLGRIDDSLVYEFAEGLRRLSRRRPIVVTLDHFEIVASCGGWLRQVMLASGPRVLWVVAARIEPESEAGDHGEMASFNQQIPEGSLQLIEMSPFGEKTIAEELAQRGVADADPGALDAIRTLTKGIPMAVSIVAGMMAQGEDLAEIGRSVSEAGDTTKLVRRLAQRYLVHAREDPRLAPDTPLLLSMALLYADRADAELLGAIWGKDHDLDATLTALAERHDFVLTTSRRLHQEVRETFRKYLLDGVRRADHRDVNRRAAEVASARISRFSPGTGIEETMDDERWRVDAATFVWHQFWQDNDAGFDALCEFFPAAILLQRPFAHELIQIASFFKDSFSAEQQALHQNLALLLSFGGFIEGWRTKRQTFLLRGAVKNPDQELEVVGASRRTALASLQARAERGGLLDTVPTPRELVELLVAKCEAQSNPAAALVALTAASGAITPGDGDLAAEVAQIAKDIAGLLVEPNHVGNFPAPTAEGMRAGELWAAYSSNRPAALLWFGRSHRERGETDEAMTAFERAEAELEPPEDPESRVELLEVKIARAIGLGDEDNETALAIYDDAIERFDGDPNRSVQYEIGMARMNRIGHVNQKSGDEEAIEEYQRFFKRYSADPHPQLRKLAIDALRHQAHLFDRTNRPELAEQTLEAAAALAGDEAREVRCEVVGIYLDLGNRLDRGGDFQRGLDFYQRILREFEKDQEEEFNTLKAKALFNVGLSLKHLGDEGAAVKAWGSLIEAIGRGADREMRRIKARGLLMQAKLLRAIAQPLDLDAIQSEFQSLLSWQDTLPETHAFYGSFLAEVAGERKEARREFEHALRFDPYNVTALSAQARLHFEDGEVESAMKPAVRALESAGRNFEVGLEMGFCVVAVGSPDLRDDSLGRIRQWLEAGARCRDWDTGRLLKRAEVERPEDIEWLRLLDRVIADKAPLDQLEEWDAWPDAASPP